MAAVEGVAPWMHIIDLDRTVYRSDMALKRLTHLVVAERVAPMRFIEEARQRIEGSGGSFDLLGCLEAHGVPDRDLQAVADRFGLNQEGREYLYPDAIPFFRALRETRTPGVIFTKGGVRTQTAKLQSGRLDSYPYEIVQAEAKVAELERRRGEGGLYWVNATTELGMQVMRAQRIFVEDDKPRAMQGLDPESRGALVIRDGRDVDLAGLSAGVVAVQDLRPLTDMIYRQAEQGAAGACIL